jgi:hypothetical protein
MRTSLIVFGVIFLVLGGFFYFVPILNLSADTSTASGGSTDVRTSSASVTIPVGWAYASAIIGFVLFVIGLAVPGRSRVVQGPQGARGPRGRSAVHHKRSASRRKSRRRSVFPRGTSVTTTTRIKR